jgi:hypothetical protein
MCIIWLSKLGSSHTTWWSLVHPFSCKWQNFILLCSWIYAFFSFMPSSVVGHLSWFYGLATVNRAALCVLASLLYIDLCSFGHMPKSGMAGSECRSLHSFLRNLHIGFHRGCTSLCSHQQCVTAFIVSFLDHCCSDWSEMGSQCSFNLHSLYV